MSENAKIIDKDSIVIYDDATQTTRVLWGNRAIFIFTSTRVVLNVAGETTTRMKNKVHRIAYELGLCFCILTTRGVWYIDTPFDGVLPYQDNIVISRIQPTTED
jgi:hypothetical protein